MNVVDVLEMVEIDPEHREGGPVGGRLLNRLIEPRAHQLTVRQRGEGIVMGQERDARLRMLALAHVTKFEQPGGAFAIRDGARCDFHRDDRAVAVGDVGVEPQLAFAEQALDHVRVSDKRGDHQVSDVVVIDADQPAETGIDRDRLHAGADRDAFVQHVEQRVEPARFVCRIARAAQQCRHGCRDGDQEGEGEPESGHQDNDRNGFEPRRRGGRLRRQERCCAENRHARAQPHAEGTRRASLGILPQRGRRFHKVLLAAGVVTSRHPRRATGEEVLPPHRPKT